MAARFLERPYALEGEVAGGRGVGSKQTVPTLNLSTDAEVIPASGVYVTRTRDLEAAASGTRSPTSATAHVRRIGERTIETFLLDPLAGPTPGRIRVAFLCNACVRSASSIIRALKARILADVRVARNYFRRRGADDLLAFAVRRADHCGGRPGLAGDNALVIAVAVRGLPNGKGG